MTKKAIVLLADGFEDVEAVTPIDYMSRAGIEVTTVSILESCLIVTSRWGGIKMTANTTLAELSGKGNDWDAVIIPGGIPGVANLAASKETGALIKDMSAAGKLICAICAAPVIVLAPLGLIAGKRFTISVSHNRQCCNGSGNFQPLHTHYILFYKIIIR